MQRALKPYGRVIVFAILWFVSYTICMLIIKKSSPDTTTGIILSIIPVISFAFFIWSIIKGVGSMDELQIRIQLEAVVIAFSLALLTMMTLGLLDMVVVLKKEDWGYRQLFPFFTLYYIVGLIVSKRKYENNEE